MNKKKEKPAGARYRMEVKLKPLEAMYRKVSLDGSIVGPWSVSKREACRQFSYMLKIGAKCA